jgi:hypothetical protein
MQIFKCTGGKKHRPHETNTIKMKLEITEHAEGTKSSVSIRYSMDFS